MTPRSELRQILPDVVMDLNRRLLDANPRVIHRKLVRMGVEVSPSVLFRAMQELVDAGLFISRANSPTDNEVKFVPTNVWDERRAV